MSVSIPRSVLAGIRATSVFEQALCRSAAYVEAVALRKRRMRLTGRVSYLESIYC